ncbi:MAG: hypothetical protein ACLU4W_04760 [Acutalibacteraceae bacterium]
MKFCRYHSRASIAQVVAGRPFNRPACGGLKESDDIISGRLPSGGRAGKLSVRNG